LVTIDQVKTVERSDTALSWLGRLVVAMSWLYLVKSIFGLHPVDGYGAGILFILGLAFTHHYAVDHIDFGERQAPRVDDPAWFE
jgi:hypothetical protein